MRIFREDVWSKAEQIMKKALGNNWSYTTRPPAEKKAKNVPPMSEPVNVENNKVFQPGDKIDGLEIHYVRRVIQNKITFIASNRMRIYLYLQG